jgi:hypothetical protein
MGSFTQPMNPQVLFVCDAPETFPRFIETPTSPFHR